MNIEMRYSSRQFQLGFYGAFHRLAATRAPVAALRCWLRAPLRGLRIFAKRSQVPSAPSYMVICHMPLPSPAGFGTHPSRERESDLSLSPGEREREIDILAQVLHLCLGACAAPLHRWGSWGVNLDCASRGAFPVSPAVLEATRPLPRCLRGPAQPFASPEPDRGPPSGGGPPVGGRGILLAS